MHLFIRLFGALKTIHICFNVPNKRIQFYLIKQKQKSLKILH
jgi:hypothetical protein